MNKDRRTRLGKIGTEGAKIETLLETLYSEWETILAEFQGKYDDIRGSLDDIKTSVEEVRDEEQDAYDNMPEGFQNGDKGSAAQEAISYMDNVVNAIEGMSEDWKEYEGEALDIESNLDDAAGVGQ